MYEDGLGVQKDYAHAAHWYRAAADQGDRSGQYDLANLYSVGRGVPLDYVSAYVLYSLASSSGDDRSSDELKRLSKRMTPRQVEQAQAQLANKKTLQPADETEASSLVPLPEGK
jgi:TPR repeat protein